MSSGRETYSSGEQLTCCAMMSELTCTMSYVHSIARTLKGDLGNRIIVVWLSPPLGLPLYKLPMTAGTLQLTSQPVRCA